MTNAVLTKYFNATQVVEDFARNVAYVITKHDHPEGHCYACGVSWFWKEPYPVVLYRYHADRGTLKTRLVHVLCRQCQRDLPDRDRKAAYCHAFQMLPYYERNDEARRALMGAIIAA